MPRVDYNTYVWCRHCGEKRLIIKCKFVVNYGYKCPECGWKCRSKARYTINRELHPYIPHSTHVYMTTELKQLAKEKARVE